MLAIQGYRGQNACHRMGGGRMNEGNGARIRILVASLQGVFCDAVRVALERESDLEVVAESRSTAEAVSAACEAQAEVVLLDASLPECGPDTVIVFGERVPACRLLFLADDHDEQTLVDVLEAGASGLLTKDRPLAELIAAVRAVHRDEMFIPQQMLGFLVSELIRRRKDRNDALVRTARLTPREREVLALLAQGLDTAEISRALVISPETARTHIQHVICKLGVHSRLEAAALIANTGILDELTTGGR
jgi:DNA-binding NarL/FixJ family response regulator